MLAATLLAGPAVAEDLAPGARITLQGDRPLAFILFNPSGEAGRVRSSALIRIVSDLVERHTDFTVRVYDAEEARGCSGRLGCIVRTVRRDYERNDYVLANGTVAPFSDHVAKLERENVAAPQYLLVMSNITGGDVDRMSVTLVDTNTALATFHEALRDDKGWKKRVETIIAERAIVARPQRGKVSEEFEARKLFEDYFVNTLRRSFEDAGHWEPYGEVQIEVPVSGVGIEVDGVTVGTTRAGVTTLTNVREGEHTLALAHPEYAPWSSTFVARRRDVVRLTPQLDERASGASAALRQTLIWGGIGVAAAGVLVTGLAIAGQDDDVMTLCFDPSASCGGKDFTTTGFAPDAAPTFDDDVNPSGILVAPLGYSLVITGATWSLTTLLFGDEGDFPWWQLVAGVAAGGAAYGISAAVD